MCGNRVKHKFQNVWSNAGPESVLLPLLAVAAVLLYNLVRKWEGRVVSGPQGVLVRSSLHLNLGQMCEEKGGVEVGSSKLHKNMRL